MTYDTVSTLWGRRWAGGDRVLELQRITHERRGRAAVTPAGPPASEPTATGTGAIAAGPAGATAAGAISARPGSVPAGPATAGSVSTGATAARTTTAGAVPGQPPRDDGGIGRRELLAGGGVLAAAGAGGWYFFLREDSSGSPESPGGSFSDAPSVSAGTHGPYRIENGEDHYFAVDLEQGEELTATIEFDHSSQGDLDLDIHGPDQMELTGGYSTTDDESADLIASQPGTYYINPYGYNGATNEYELQIEIQ